MVVVEPALAMVAEEADTGVLPLFPVPALISEDVGVVAPVGRMTHRTFSTNVMVKGYTMARRPLQAMLGTFFTFAGFKLLLSRT